MRTAARLFMFAAVAALVLTSRGLAEAPHANAFDAAWVRLRGGPAYTAQKTGAFQIRYPFRNGVE
jgi:hypothetical protein